MNDDLNKQRMPLFFYVFNSMKILITITSVTVFSNKSQKKTQPANNGPYFCHDDIDTI